MKKYISCLLTLALFIPALVSCTRELKDDISQNNTHLVHFSTSNPETKTGLKIENGIAYPDWRETKLENIHFFEMSVNGGEPSYGEALSIDESEDYTTAHFTASFTEDMTIHVDPPTRAGDSDMYYYGAVVAQKPNEDDLTFVIPAEQKPDAATLKDPDADFLVGYSRKACEAYVDDENVVDLYFDRVAALGRLSFTHFKTAGEKVKSVTINSTNGLVGSAAYSDITFGEKNTVTFTRAAGPLTLSFGDGRAVPTEGAFEAYFVVIPGEATITSIEVLTDKYHYTKAIDGGKAFTFSNEAFKNINMDLDTADAEEVSAVWYKASMLENGIDYIIVSQGKMLNNGADGLTGEDAPTDNNGIITFDSTPAASVIWTAATLSGLEEFGHFTLSNGGKYLYRYSQESTQYMVIGDLPQEPTKHYVWDFDGTYLYHVSSASENRNFYCYYSNEWTTDYTKSNAKPVTIYTTRAPQELSFDKESVEYDFDAGGEFEEPTLSAAGGTIYGAVTYSSDNTDVATVDSESGAVTIVKAGTAIITATAAGNAEYQAATASYTIVANTAALPTWYKAEEVENNGIYMVVSNGNALNLDGTSISTVSNDEFSGASFHYEANDNLKWTATVSTDGKFTLKNGSRYLSRSSGNIQTSSSSGASLSYDSENNYVTTKGTSSTSSTYYIYYATGSSSGWKASTTQNTATLYTVKHPRNLAFASNKVTHDLADGDDVNEPELEGVKTGVTYKSSNVEVATVDASTGVVNLTGTRGSAKITATAEKTETLQGGSASYTLKVTDSRIPNKTYKKITSTGDLVVGTQYLLVFEGLADDTDGDGDPKVFLPISASSTTFSKSQDNALEVTISNNTIVSNEFDYCHLTLESGYYLKSDKVGSYLYPTGNSSAGGSLSAEATASNALSISFNNGIAQIKTTSGSYYLVWSTSSHYFSSNTSVSGQYSTGICLYKLEDGRQPQTLSFNPSTATYDLANPSSFEKPSLSTAYGEVTYSSSDATIAEVNNSGTITGKKKGTVTITATAAGDNQYKPGSASYTLTVTDSSAPDKYYVLVTSEPASWDGTYLIVNTAADGTGSALNGTSTASVTISGGKILSTSTIDGYALTVTSAGEVHPNQTDSSQGLIAYDIKFSDGNWLYWFSSKYTQTSEDQNSRHNKCTLYYDNGGVRLMSAGYNVDLNGNPLSSTPSKNYLYWTGSAFTMDSSHSSSRVQLYKLDDDGSNPGGGDDPEPPTPTTSTYTRISGDAELVTGTYLIVDKTNTYLFNASGTNHGGYSTIGSTSGITMSGLTITLTSTVAAESEFVLTRSGDNLTIKPVGGDNAGKYMYATNNVSNTYIDFQTSENNFVINSQSGDYVYFSTTKGTDTSEYLYKKASDSFFKLGGSGAPGGEHAGIYLYKKVENP